MLFIFVHCICFVSAGVGRTGVFIALTNLIERLKTEAVVDVYQTVKKLRQQRTAMVQTKVGLLNEAVFVSKILVEIKLLREGGIGEKGEDAEVRMF